MAKEAKIRFPLSIDLSESDVQKLKESTNQDIAAAIQGWAASFLRDYANGGLMLTGRNIDAIEQATGKKVASPDDVVSEFSKAVGCDEGQFVLKASLDPALRGVIEEIAEFNGLDAQDILSQIVDQVITNGWIYNYEAPDEQIIRLSKEEMEVVKEFAGKKRVLGADLIEAIKKSQVEV